MTNYEKLITDRVALATIAMNAWAIDVNDRDPYLVYKYYDGRTTLCREKALEYVLSWLDKEAE